MVASEESWLSRAALGIENDKALKGHSFPSNTQDIYKSLKGDGGHLDDFIKIVMEYAFTKMT